MAMLLKLQEAANYIESPDKEDISLPKLWNEESQLTPRTSDWAVCNQKDTPFDMIVGVALTIIIYKLWVWPLS